MTIHYFGYNPIMYISEILNKAEHLAATTKYDIVFQPYIWAI